MLLAFTLSFLAMVYLTVVQIMPNWMANFMMGTATLDNGEFLLMSKPSQAIVVTSALMLSMFACLYLWLIVFMLSYNSETTVNNLARTPDPKSLSYRVMQKFLPLLKRIQAQTKRASSNTAAAVVSTPRNSSQTSSFGSRISSFGSQTSSFGSRTASRLISDFTSIEGTYHRYYDAVLDFPKLIFQTMSLSGYLSKGFPLPIIFFYVLPLGFNWLISFYRFQRNKPDPMLVVARVFYLFDLFFAVFAPIVMLLYSYYNFNMDRANFATREETLTPGSFDRIARLFADPIQVQMAKTSLANLQITGGEYILVKCFLNLLGIYKWKKVIAHLILANRSRREEKGALALSTSITNCSPYYHCPVYSYRWEWGQKSTCPCIVFIDRELAPKTYNEWINAPNVTDPLSALASNGYLQTVQIINRALPELPEALRQCKTLKDLILIYTKTRRFPEWTKELHTYSTCTSKTIFSIQVCSICRQIFSPKCTAYDSFARVGRQV
ncbi:hypothetical protein PF005_g3567 [Phytophthora fragariae]|uniref:Uncharacterized protein n=1 Tax=Phytophthora fragariae TaxID=53985 RepID=A0A6A3Z517_9STRA|nr:hypothetical protein PF010_g3158 [Phytophthora fragariae]KAE9230218.1 hypothetical protein PF005_g3567 [Phytophthora fragariae]